ncbi:hypothetical protein J2847_006760 [Azospirillum agricola]|uniref:hypothetical protein n=1 Tax=Azospirillum agricola TaxID=1720247 RepID=UPI001AE98F9C|nr:hypothetical protein [Azospirillum agricola]MBP2233422.1 hypothetical protein [Azospirillum agricola]
MTEQQDLIRVIVESVRSSVPKYLEISNLDSPSEVPERYLQDAIFNGLGNVGHRVRLETPDEQGHPFDIAILHKTSDPWKYSSRITIELKKGVRAFPLKADAEHCCRWMDASKGAELAVIGCFIVGSDAGHIERLVEDAKELLHGYGFETSNSARLGVQTVSPISDVHIPHRSWDFLCFYKGKAWLGTVTSASAADLVHAKPDASRMPELADPARNESLVKV